MSNIELAKTWKPYISDNNVIPHTRTPADGWIQVPSGFRRYVAVMPFPRQTLQLIKLLFGLKENEFGIPSQQILAHLKGYCQACNLKVEFPQKWPEDLELNHLQANTFLASVLIAAMEKVVPPATKILPGQFKFGLRKDSEFWISETLPWIYLFPPEMAASVDTKSAGVWDVLLPKDGSTFDIPFSPDVRLTLIESKEYYHRQTRFILWQLSQKLNQNLGCFIWLAGQTTKEKPELVFQKIKGD